MLKKFLFGAITALCLITSTANAHDSLYMPDYGVTDTAQYQALDTGVFNDMRTLLTFQNGNGPKLIAEPSYFYVGSTKLTDLLAAKQDASTAFDGAYSHLTGAPSAFSGAYVDLTGKPSIPSTFDDLSAGTTNKAYTATEKTKLAGLANVASTGAYSDLSGKPSIPSAQIQSDWNQASTGALDYIKNKPSLAAVATSGVYSDLTSKPSIPTIYDGTSARTNPVIVFKSATVSAGVATFFITADNTSTGTALCPNGIISSSVNPIVNDATAAYQMSWAWTNSNKTLTVTANKLTTANILTGILGQSNANGASVNVTVACY